jgi:hypothetical protein
MDELKTLALELLEIERRFLLEDKEEYRTAAVVVITPEKRYWEEVEFDSEAEKISAYAGIVNRAKESGATAIITINTSFASTEKRSQYQWGDLEHEGAPREITLTISGPSIESCSLSLPFAVENDSVRIGERSDFEAALIGLLPNWP